MKYCIITDQISQDLETALIDVQKHNYTYVELHNVFGKSIEECNEEELQEIKRLLKKYNVQVANISSTVFFLCPLYKGDQVSLFNDEFFAPNVSYEDHLHNLENACHIAKELNCPNVRIFPFRFPDNRKGPYGTDEQLERIISLVKEAVEIAKKYDVTLVMENCPYSHLPKGKMTLKVIQAINDSHLHLLWDPANSYRAVKENVPEEYLHDTLMEELKAVYPYIGHIHIKNYRFNPTLVKPFEHVEVFDGDIDFKEMLQYLKDNHCENYLSLEAEVPYEHTINSMVDFKSFIEQM